MKSVHAALLCAALLAPLSSQAATLSASYPTAGGTLTATLVATGSDALGLVDQQQSTDLPDGASWTTPPSTVDASWYTDPKHPEYALDPCLLACSPYYSGVLGAPTVDTGWKETAFFSVFEPVADISEALLTFATPQTVLSFLWGSPDNSNFVELLLDETPVGSFWGGNFSWLFPDAGVVGSPGAGAALLTLTGVTFDSVRFVAYADGGSFEFTNVSNSLIPVPVPLPPALLAMLAALGMGGLVFRKRTGTAATV